MSISQKLTDCLNCGKLNGTLLRLNNGTMSVYYSPLLWHSPIDGYAAQPDKWVYLGTEGWNSTRTNAELFARVKALAGDMFPAYPGEFSEFLPQLAL